MSRDRRAVELGGASLKIERISGEDLMELAAESAGTPMQVAAVLVLAGQLELDTVRRTLASRLQAVPRLRQRLVSAPPACGRPFWVADPGFRVERHVGSHRCPAPGDDAALFDVAAQAASHPLPRDRPLWSMTLVRGVSGGRDALVLVMHHVVADGIGGLAALARLVDGASPPPDLAFPTWAPTVHELLADAMASRLRAVGHLRRGGRLLRDAIAELRVGQVSPPPRSSLNKPTGPRRRFTVARADLGAVTAAAHAVGGTVNDVLLTAAAGALGAVLHSRGEAVESVVVSVPVSARREASATQLGNRVGAIPVTVPTSGEPAERLAAVVSELRGHRRKVGRGASAVLLGLVFRALARLRLLRWFLNSQRLVTTFVTNIRGPQDQYTFAGVPISEMIALAPISGNVTVGFAALSYASSFAVTVMTDPTRCPELTLLGSTLQAELDRLCAGPPPDRVG